MKPIGIIKSLVNDYNTTVGEAWEKYDGTEDLMDMEKYHETIEKAERDLVSQLSELITPQPKYNEDRVREIGRQRIDWLFIKYAGTDKHIQIMEIPPNGIVVKPESTKKIREALEDSEKAK